jgi:DNA-binding transcriptional regulator YdaS (Cro superfamily)
MPAAFDIITVANETLEELRCPASTLAGLSGISGAKLSQYLNGVVRIGAQDELKLRKTIAALRKLVEYASPLPLDYRRVGEIRRLLDTMEAGILQVVVFEQDREPEASESQQQ